MRFRQRQAKIPHDFPNRFFLIKAGDQNCYLVQILLRITNDLIIVIKYQTSGAFPRGTDTLGASKRARKTSTGCFATSCSHAPPTFRTLVVLRPTPCSMWGGSLSHSPTFVQAQSGRVTFDPDIIIPFNLNFSTF